MELIDGLSSYYKFDGNGNDSHSTRNLSQNGTITYTTGALGQCAILNGTNAWFSGTHNLGTGNIDFSYYIWVYVTGTQTRGEIFSIGNPSSLNTGIHFSIRGKSGGNDAIYFDLSQTAGSSTTNRINYNSWNFIGIKKSGSTISIKINGNSFENFTAPGTLNVSTSDLRISTYDGTNARLTGNIDEGAIFSVVKSDVDFTTAWNNGTPLGYPLVSEILNPEILLNFLT